MKYNDEILDFFEINNNEEKCQIIAYGKKQIFLTTLNFNPIKKEKPGINILWSNIFETNNIFYLINGLYENFHLINISTYYANINGNNLINEILYFNGIQINEDIIVLTISSELIKQYNKIIFYNIKIKKVIKTIEEYSLSFNRNNLELIPGKDINNKILLCGCNKIDDKKNGILLLKIQFGDNIDIKHYFQETKALQIYCFSPIILDSDTIEKYSVLLLKNYNKKINFCENNKDNIYKSNEYFLAGVYDKDKDKNLIKLFQIINEENNNIEIKDLQEIIFNSEIDYCAKIICINQSEKSREILVSCSDGKVYLLKAPNIDYYLEKDMKEKNNLFNNLI